MAVAAGIPSSPVSLALSVAPPNLPSDGGTFPVVFVYLRDGSGLPTVSAHPINVLLTSSQESVGTIPPSVVIPAGRDYAIANFTTTKIPGETTITASTSGLRTASTIVSTVTAAGYPTRLTVSAVPSEVLARPSSTGELFVELIDDVGLPAKAIDDLQVSLFSSNTNVLNVNQPTLTIHQGDFVELINYTSGLVPGTATITASALGFESGTTSVTVLGNAPLALKLYPQPATMITCVGGITFCSGRLVVALTDLSGNPVPAPRPVTVQIRVSNLGVITAPESVTIPAGSISTTASATATTIPGTAVVTVSAPGLQSSFATISTYRPVGPPTQLVVSVGPNPVLADHNAYSSVVVSLVNSTGYPTVNMTGTTTVTLTSSVTGVGNFSSITFGIPQAENYASTDFTSTYLVGTTQLTASAQDLAAAQTNLITFGPVPSKVVMTALSPTLPADGSSHPALQVILEDTAGDPAVAPFDIPVNLFTSQSGVVSVSPATIRRGQTFAVVNAQTGAVQGSANITAFVSSLTSGAAVSSVILNVVIPAPSAIAAYFPIANAVYSPTGDFPPLFIQLQDASSSPARARAPINLTITSSNTTVISGVLNFSIAPGQDLAPLKLKPHTTGQTQLTLSAQGLLSAEVTVSYGPYPLVAAITQSASTIFTNQTATLNVEMGLAGGAVANASVTWKVQGGSLSKTQTVTDNSGISAVTFTPTQVGPAVVTASVTEPAFGTKNLTATVVVITAPNNSRGIIQMLTTFPGYLVFVGVAAAVVAVLVIMMRRRRGGGGEEEGGGEEGVAFAFPIPRFIGFGE
jgi:hypothetical protein